MATLHVLVDDKGNVVGTALAGSSGTGAPSSSGFLAGPGQRMVQVTIDDKVASLDAAALHETVKTRLLATATPVTNESVLANLAARSRAG